MKKYRVTYDRKDYGDGGATLTVFVNANTPDEAELVVKETRCGVEEIFGVVEV